MQAIEDRDRHTWKEKIICTTIVASDDSKDQGKDYVVESAFTDSGRYSIRDRILSTSERPIKW